MKKIIVFLLILTSCNSDICMNISKASEIHFWPSGTGSFNMKQYGYTDEYCFYQKFLCTSQRKFQGTGDNFNQDFYLIGEDEDGNELYNSIFTKTAQITQGTNTVHFDNEEFDLDILGWTNYAPSPSTEAWAWAPVGPGGAGCAVVDATSTSHFSDSQQLYAGQTPALPGGYDKHPPGTYKFKIGLSNNSVGGSAPQTEGLSIRAFDTPGVFGEVVSITIPRGGGFIEYDVTFITTQHWNFMSLDVYKQGVSDSDINVAVNYFRIVESPELFSVLYEENLIPSAFAMCDKKVKFRIFKGPDSSTDTEILFSDLIDFVSVWANSTHDGRVNVQFKSVQNFAGLIYNPASTYFNIELDARFRKERQVTNQKVLELTEQVINTASSLKTQRRLSIDDLPDYMHTKIVLILQHAISGSLVIDGVEYVLEDSYEVGERPDTYPLSPADVWLTEKSSYTHNVI